jgi:NADP-dependent 3-hydroxy acid dehydrogenase YdfG
MPQILESTVAPVTGASSETGEATALALASEGASVALVARRRDRLDALTEPSSCSGWSRRLRVLRTRGASEG